MYLNPGASFFIICSSDDVLRIYHSSQEQHHHPLQNFVHSQNLKPVDVLQYPPGLGMYYNFDLRLQYYLFHPLSLHGFVFLRLQNDLEWNW